MPLIPGEGLRYPGTEAKELFRPLASSPLAQLADAVAVGAVPLRMGKRRATPEGGTYRPGRLRVQRPRPRQFLSGGGPGFAPAGQAASEPKQAGEWGSARWSPAWLDGTLGVYARRFSDKLPQTPLTAAGPGTSVYNLGVRGRRRPLRREPGEEHRRREPGRRVLAAPQHAAQRSQVLGVAPGLPGAARPASRGDTQHALLNLLGSISATPLFDSASWAARIQWSRWTKGAQRREPSTRSATPLQQQGPLRRLRRRTTPASASFTPSWFQVLPGVDLSRRSAMRTGHRLATRPVVFGGKSRAWAASPSALSADVQQKYRFDLKYVDYLGPHKDNGTAVTSTNGPTTFLKDRGFVSLTFKTSF